jgi:hypothetical protein
MRAECASRGKITAKDAAIEPAAEIFSANQLPPKDGTKTAIPLQRKWLAKYSEDSNARNINDRPVKGIILRF